MVLTALVPDRASQSLSNELQVTKLVTSRAGVRTQGRLTPGSRSWAGQGETCVLSGNGSHERFGSLVLSIWLRNTGKKPLHL